MEFITERDEDYVWISKQSDLEEVNAMISERQPFAYLFKFSERIFFTTLLESLAVNYEHFTSKYYYYDPIRKLHITESKFGYVWISTNGLVARKKVTSNSSLNSCVSQYTVISALIDKAIATVRNESVYDIDSYQSGVLSELSPAIFHNMVFYIEVFCKAYLSLSKEKVPHSHKLQLIYQKTVETMNNKGHGNSLFQVMIVDPLHNYVDHISKIPGEFKEQFIKYDDNPQDETVIIFELESLSGLSNLLDLSKDFIFDYFYEGDNARYLKSNFYQRIVEKAETEEERIKIEALYSHLKK